MVERATPEDLVFRELVHLATLPDHVELRRALQGLRGEQQLRCVISAVMGIVEANTRRDASDEEIQEFYLAWDGVRPINGGQMAPLPDGGLALVHPGEGPMIGGIARVCSHRECPHLARCIGAGDCTDPAFSMPAVINGVVGDATVRPVPTPDLPSYLPLRKIVGEGGDA